MTDIESRVGILEEKMTDLELATHRTAITNKNKNYKA